MNRRLTVVEFLRSGGLQLGLTAACAAAGLGGAAVGRWAPESELRLPLYFTSYLTGAFGPTRDLIRNLLARQLDINLLMIVAALGSALLGHWGEGAVLLFLFSLSGALERITMERTARSIESLMQLRPETALVLRDGVEVRVLVGEIAVGERVRALPGERFAVDGVIVEGTSSADEATLTGESEPVEKVLGSKVFAGTVNQRGAPVIRVEKRPEETAISRIVQAVHEAQKTKTTTERFVDRWQRPYVLSVFGAAALAAAIPYFALGLPVLDAVYRGLVLLVAASPCAVVIATPAAMLSAVTHAARHGVLFKGSAHLERLGEISAVAMDKTGTITHGKPRVVAVESAGCPGSPERLLRLAAAVEARSEHHTGRAIVAEAERLGLSLPPVSEFESHAGEGVHGHVEGIWVGAGREPLFTRHDVAIPPGALALARRWREEGRTAILVVARRSVDGRPHPEAGDEHDLACGAIAVADTVRPQARRAVAACRALGIRHVAILTGDHAGVARAIGREIGTDEVRAGLLPEQKVLAIRELSDRWGGLAMVGDGVNDAPALATATVGIAMGGAGTDVALDTADVVLMRDDLEGIPFSLWLARQSRRVVAQSLSLAFGVIGILVISTLAGVLPLWIAVVCHEGSTLLVIANGVRLLGVPHPDFELG
ncbi:MAG TPA: heavy metal translocating P-type ATPase [Candidatus Eisenbacteria bacterium]